MGFRVSLLTGLVELDGSFTKRQESKQFPLSACFPASDHSYKWNFSAWLSVRGWGELMHVKQACCSQELVS